MRISSGVIAVALLSLPTLLPAQRTATGFLDRSVTVSGNAYHYQVYVPFDYSADRAWPVILFLHGAGERGSDGLLQTQVGLGAAIRRNPSSYPAIVIFPQVAKDSTFLGTFTDVAMGALDQTMREFHTDPARVYLTGLSMGGQGTWHVAYLDPERFAAIAPICGFVSALAPAQGWKASVPADSGDVFATLARRVRALPTWVFHGEMDPVVSVKESRQAYDAIKAAGGDVRYTEFLGLGHEVWDGVYGSRQFQEWLFAQHREH